MKITPLKMWVQNVLPVVYDDSLSYYEMVGKINEKTNEIITQVNENTDDIEALNYVIQELGDIDELKALLEEVETIVSDLYSSDIPVMDSETGSAGVADHAARSDHSHPSDSSKADVSLGIDSAAAGQYVKIKTVEAGVPTEFENGMPHEIPSGGTTGQALRKESNGDYAADWSDVHEIPSGGNTNSILQKNSNSDYSAEWVMNPKLMESFAIINYGATADRNYNAGDYLVFNGLLYKAKENISQNVSIDTGANGNVEAINVKDTYYDVNTKGSYTVSIICGGYITNSGNYVDAYLPIKVKPGLTISITIPQQGKATVFIGSNRLEDMIDAVSILRQDSIGLTLEAHFTANQSVYANNQATVSFANAVISVT